MHWLDGLTFSYVYHYNAQSDIKLVYLLFLATDIMFQFLHENSCDTSLHILCAETRTVNPK